MSGSPVDQVTVVCVTYRSARLAETMAATLCAFPHVVIVDNGSGDGGPARLRELLPHARVIERATNGGFGRASNEGVRAATTPFVLLLNPDCHIDMASLARLLDTLQRYPTAGLVAPQSWRPDGTAQVSYRQAFFERVPRAPYRVPDATCSAKWLHGCCLLIRTQAFARIGGFDEQFFLYYEDDDLCLRMHQAGLECLLEPAANALHVGGASSGGSAKVAFVKAYHYARSRHLAIRRYQGPKAALGYLVRTLLGGVPAVPLYALLLQRDYTIRWFGWTCAAAASLLRLAAADPSASGHRPGSQP
ncbi:glycosyltransferase family 2 protein [Lysobacter arvi]|uniref:Glycosyltransferase family 2 protein n=1 Tax=Lysobacter arvi TaxID=3038776 RepID=A0ABU1CH75_9GAMM|nr:glycosyltransferase family 2 protein [Lysobacter arvi]MDR0184287.1 glycosyltransferase family 2 protein [Lysobacter arvi]